MTLPLIHCLVICLTFVDFLHSEGTCIPLRTSPPRSHHTTRSSITCKTGTYRAPRPAPSHTISLPKLILIEVHEEHAALLTPSCAHSLRTYTVLINPPKPLGAGMVLLTAACAAAQTPWHPCMSPGSCGPSHWPPRPPAPEPGRCSSGRK